MKFRTYFIAALLLAWTLVASPLLAEPMNRIDLQAEAASVIPNDLLVATMGIEVQEQDTASVARQLNATINAALDKAMRYKTVKVSSGWQNTSPVYGKNNQISGWRGSAQINLESRDFNAASNLIGSLQDALRLTGISFQVSPEARQLAEDALITSALNAFNGRADTVKRALHASGFQIVHIGINADGGDPAPYLRQPRAMKMSAEISESEFSGGDTRIVVRVSGTIALNNQ